MPPAVTLETRPRLVAKARLHYDRVRGQHLLLLPERVVILTETAHAILSLCDGSRAVGEIVAALEARYPGAGAAVREETLAFLQRVRDRGWVV